MSIVVTNGYVIAVLLWSVITVLLFRHTRTTLSENKQDITPVSEF